MEITARQKRRNKLLRLTETAILLAIATVLAVVKLYRMPYGGSITLASMLPMVIISYRHGIAWGAVSGLIYGIIQQLLSLEALGWVPTLRAQIILVIFDYVGAYALSGLGGIFRKARLSEKSAITLGALFICILRFVCHFVSGMTIWRDTELSWGAAIIYSIIYNLSYMLPETIITVAAAFYIGDVLDLKKLIPERRRNGGEENKGSGDIKSSLLGLAGNVVLFGGIVFDTIKIFSMMTFIPSLDADPEFSFSGIMNTDFADWLPVIIVSAACVAVFVALKLAAKKMKK